MPAYPEMSPTIFKSIGAGAFFGAALTASQVYLPTVIIRQMQLRDFHMLQAFLTASATSAIVQLTFEQLGISRRQVRSNSSLNWFGRYDANILGGALIGIGMTLTGACPGTVLAQLATGIPSSIYVATGAVLGGAFYAKFGKSLVARGQSSPPTTNETIGAKFGIDPVGVFFAFETLCAIVVSIATFLTQKGSYAWLHPITGGLFIGAAQAVSIYLTSTPLGTSAAYEQIGRYLLRALGQDDVSAPPSPPQSLLFALGMLGGSAALANSGCVPPVPVEILQVSRVNAMFGGFLMVLGARAAGGCTSGHGISGLSAFSFASLVTVAAMFGGGIATAMLWG